MQFNVKTMLTCLLTTTSLMGMDVFTKEQIASRNLENRIIQGIFLAPLAPLHYNSVKSIYRPPQFKPSDNFSPEEKLDIQVRLRQLQYNARTPHRIISSQLLYPFSIASIYAGSNYLAQATTSNSFQEALPPFLMGSGLMASSELIRGKGHISGILPNNKTSNLINCAFYAGATIATGLEAKKHFEKSYDLWNKGQNKQACLQFGAGTAFGIAMFAPFVMNYYAVDKVKFGL